MSAGVIGEAVDDAVEQCERGFAFAASSENLRVDCEGGELFGMSAQYFGDDGGRAEAVAGNEARDGAAQRERGSTRLQVFEGVAERERLVPSPGLEILLRYEDDARGVVGCERFPQRLGIGDEGIRCSQLNASFSRSAKGAMAASKRSPLSLTIS